MRIRNHLFLAALLVFLAAFMTWGAEPFVLEELHLVHWEQVPEGRPSFTGPVSAAVLMAWHAEHGYPDLLPDLNGDGRTDEEDTILLARDFGEEMGGDIIDDRLADPFIVYPLARYVAERYPDEFRMLIYDESFPEEVVQDLGQPFSPTDVPGIVLDVLEDPFYELYIFHLEELRPGIVGIGFDMPEWNDFTVSRSYIPEELPAGMPVDLVSTGFEQFVPEPVWETIMRLEPERWGFLTPEWIPFETLIILIPQDDVEGMHDGPATFQAETRETTQEMIRAETRETTLAEIQEMALEEIRSTPVAAISLVSQEFLAGSRVEIQEIRPRACAACQMAHARRQRLTRARSGVAPLSPTRPVQPMSALV